MELFHRYGHPGEPGFEEQYIVSNAHTLGDGSTVHVRSHVAVAGRLHRVWQQLSDSGHLSQIRTYAGCFNIRTVRGGTALSLHSWGLAVDLNTEAFPLGSLHRQAPELVAAFHEEHFLNGADYRHRKDPEHFQFCRVLF
jgi:hypothetical protein